MRLALATLAILSAVAPLASRAQAPKTEEEKTFYAMGLVAARSFADLKLSPRELDLVKKGLSDALTPGKKIEVDLSAYEQKVQEMARKRLMAAAELKKEKEKAFADKAAGEKGAQRSDTGLVYLEIKEGTGESPKTTDTVKVHYAGKLTDGKEFDSSYRRGQPVEFPLNGVIPCWTEGLQKMKPGGKAKLVCPSSIAYGDTGRPPVIPGGATLVFEVELLEIVKK